MKGRRRFCQLVMIGFVLMLAVVMPASAVDEVYFEVSDNATLEKVIEWANSEENKTISKHFTITLIPNEMGNVIRLESELKIEGNVTIQPAPYTTQTIKSPVGSHAFNVTKTGNLTLLESPSGSGSSQLSVLVIEGAETNTKSLVRVGEGGTFTLKGGILSKNNAEKGGAVYVDKGTFIMSGGVIQGNTAKMGGGVYMVDGTFTQAGSIRGNYAENGGGVYIEGGTYSMEGGELYKNQASTDGGGLYIKGGEVTLNGGKIEGNTASGNGGGIFINDGKRVVIENGDISNNHASGNGGGIFINGQEVEMEKGNIYGNQASGNGGAVYINNTGFWMEKGNIYNNQASGNGGAVYINNAHFQMYDGSLYQNSAGIGSAVYLNVATFTMNSGSIHSNTATGSGGVVYVGKHAEDSESNMFQMLGGSITNNYADFVGGVVVEGYMSVHGSPVIAENTGPDLYLIETTLIIPYEGEQDVVGLTDGARIGIAHSDVNQETPTLVAIGEGLSNYIGHNYLKYIFSDAEDYKVVVDGRQLYLVYDPPEPPKQSSVWISAPSNSKLGSGIIENTNGGTVNFPEGFPFKAVTIRQAGEVTQTSPSSAESTFPVSDTRQILASADLTTTPALPSNGTGTVTIEFTVPTEKIPQGHAVGVYHRVASVSTTSSSDMTNQNAMAEAKKVIEETSAVIDEVKSVLEKYSNIDAIPSSDLLEAYYEIMDAAKKAKEASQKAGDAEQNVLLNDRETVDEAHKASNDAQAAAFDAEKLAGDIAEKLGYTPPEKAEGSGAAVWKAEKVIETGRSDGLVHYAVEVNSLSPFVIVVEQGGAEPAKEYELDYAPPLDHEPITATPAESPAPLLSVVAGLLAGFVVLRRR